MKGFLEQYGIGIFVLVLMSILIAFASPIGKTIKNDITAKVNNIEEITDDETEIAKGNYYTIVFDGNGATSGSMEPMKVICGREFKIPNCKFKKDGASWSTMWNTKADGTGRNYFYNAGSYLPSANNGEIITLYAIWGYRMDLNSILDGKLEFGSHKYGTCDLYVNGTLKYKNKSDFNEILQIGDTYEIKNIKATKGHTYGGVYEGNSWLGWLNAIPLFGICSDQFPNSGGLYLIFNSNTYTITYHANASDATGTTASSHHTYDKSASLTQNGFTRPGYTFLGWNTAADGSGITYTDMQEVKNLTDQNNVNIDLYAMWKAN